MIKAADIDATDLVGSVARVEQEQASGGLGLGYWGDRQGRGGDEGKTSHREWMMTIAEVLLLDFAPEMHVGQNG